MDNQSYDERTVTIDGEEIAVDAVKDPRMGKMGTWHARGVYRAEYLMAKGDNLEQAYQNWEKKARELPSPS